MTDRASLRAYYEEKLAAFVAAKREELKALPDTEENRARFKSELVAFIKGLLPDEQALLDHVGPLVYADDGGMSISFTVSGLRRTPMTKEQFRAAVQEIISENELESICEHGRVFAEEVAAHDLEMSRRVLAVVESMEALVAYAKTRVESVWWFVRPGVVER